MELNNHSGESKFRSCGNWKPTTEGCNCLFALYVQDRNSLYLGSMLRLLGTYLHMFPFFFRFWHVKWAQTIYKTTPLVHFEAWWYLLGLNHSLDKSIIAIHSWESIIIGTLLALTHWINGFLTKCNCCSFCLFLAAGWAYIQDSKSIQDAYCYLTLCNLLGYDLLSHYLLMKCRTALPRIRGRKKFISISWLVNASCWNGLIDHSTWAFLLLPVKC